MSTRWRLLEKAGFGPDFTLLDEYVSELNRWNKAIRLVGPRDEEGIARQVVDSLGPFFIEPPTFPLLDIGSGAGLPAIPLACLWRGERVVCLEPRAKRASFLRHMVRHLGLDTVEVAEGRAEEVIKSDPAMAGSFSTVTARAVASVEELLEMSRPYLASEGKVVLGRGPQPPVMVEGWRLRTDENYLGPGGEKRTVLVYLPDNQ